MRLCDFGVGDAKPQLLGLLVDRGLGDQLREQLAIEPAARVPDRA